jgi:hypothetical protein
VVHNRLHVLFLYCYSPCQGIAEYLVCAESHNSNEYSGLRENCRSITISLVPLDTKSGKFYSVHLC